MNHDRIEIAVTKSINPMTVLAKGGGGTDDGTPFRFNRSEAISYMLPVRFSL